MLTERQLDHLNRAANLLPVAAQPPFRQAVGTMLGYAQHPLDDRDVLDVLRVLLAQRGLSISAVLPPPKREFARIERKKHHAATTGPIL